MPSGIYKRKLGMKTTRGLRWKHSPESKLKMSLSAISRGIHPVHNKPHSEETKKKISEKIKGLLVGSRNGKWLSDRTKLKRRDVRNDSMYKDWRKQVKDRDRSECRIKNQDCSGRLEAHHILGFTEHPKLRYELNNGITLCIFHHPRRKQDSNRLSPFFQVLLKDSK